ncbi:methane monooxygenase PmoA-like [Chitinophaga niastensis]|uniref:Methane monooxygenase PmoA-like n=1 Tax=Chitinophaga niastensis TaxID=536980 RepID=A0A2P8HKA1_CHINA|nr:PmoA family protein [Chitinophaga niastensis]PSL46648.1 methane monooxygenase PmoA-like [Chitinophaga niastensis]
MKNFPLLFLLLLSVSASAQTIACFTVKAGNINRNNSLVYATYNTGDTDAVVLEEVTGKKRVPVPVNALKGKVWWVMSGKTPAGTVRKYELKKGITTARPLMIAGIQSGSLLLQQGEQPILQYNYQTVDPPAGTDTVFRRSGFIHPLWAPNGAVLTNIFPNAGHRHHMGIWNSWTHTLFEGRETDFWNVQKREGKVRYAGKMETFSGSVWCGFSAGQEHVALLKDGTEKTAINEVWLVQAYPATDGGNRRQWDLTSTFSPATPDGIILLQYRYGGGFALRTTTDFIATTSQLLTSEGKTRKDADSTRARWVKITGTTPKGKAGLLIMNYPENYDSPEPLRVWPENMEGGELMFNYTPTRMQPWQLHAGVQYQLKYRVMVYNGDLTPEEAEAAWQEYAHPPEVIRGE